VSPATNHGGANARWAHSGQFGSGDYETVLGASGDYQIQHRSGKLQVDKFEWSSFALQNGTGS
jgi:hypothetical protein